MNSRLTLTSAIAIVALSLAAAPVGAQDRGHSARQRGGERTSSRAASAPRQGGERQAAPRAVERQAAPRSVERQAPAPQARSRGNEAPRSAAPQSAPRYFAPQAAPRSSEGRRSAVPQAAPRGNVYAPVAPRAVPRPTERYQPQGSWSGGGHGYVQPRGGYGGYGGYGSYGSHTYVRPRNFVPYRPYYFGHSYYTFRPHFELGFGIWLGYPVPYPWVYYGTYHPRVYGYYNVLPAQQYYGGLSFDIQPSDADLYVDGQYVGAVGTFAPYGEPLTLVPGLHRIAIVRDGYRTIEFDVTIEAGQVFPYRGVMVQW